MTQLCSTMKVLLTVTNGNGVTSTVLNIEDEDLWLSLYIHYRNLQGKVDIPALLRKVKEHGLPKSPEKTQNREIIDMIKSHHWTTVTEVQRAFPAIGNKHYIAALFQAARTEEGQI